MLNYLIFVGKRGEKLWDIALNQENISFYVGTECVSKKLKHVIHLPPFLRTKMTQVFEIIPIRTGNCSHAIDEMVSNYLVQVIVRCRTGAPYTNMV